MTFVDFLLTYAVEAVIKASNCSRCRSCIKAANTLNRWKQDKQGETGTLSLWRNSALVHLIQELHTQPKKYTEEKVKSD